MLALSSFTVNPLSFYNEKIGLNAHRVIPPFILEEAVLSTELHTQRIQRLILFKALFDFTFEAWDKKIRSGCEQMIG